MKKILHIITGLEKGGAENVLFKLVKNDTKFKHIIISLGGPGHYGKLLKKQGFLVYCINLRKSFLDLKKIFYIRKIIKIKNPDLIQTWMYHGNLIGSLSSIFLKNKKVYWNIRQSNDDKTYTSLNTRLIIKLCAILSKFLPKKIICPSKSSIKIHINSGYPKYKFIHINNGFEIDKFKEKFKTRHLLRKKLKIHGNTCLFGMLARWHPQKDHVSLINSFKILKDDCRNKFNWKLLLVGKGILKNKKLNDLLKEKKLLEQTILEDDTDNVNGFLSALDINILSSSYGEAFPNIIGEAMSCSTPTIATNVGDSSLILGNHGWIAKPHNPRSLYNCIIRAYRTKKNKKKWNNLKKLSRDRIVEKFTIKKMINNYQIAWSKEL